ncbi:hypothetical protein R83H12_03173 [Fibrobacteria bacterium R8-3-H12]
MKNLKLFLLTLLLPLVAFAQLQITTASLPDGKKGFNYSQGIYANDAATLSIESGDLPPGLSLSSWYISGNPTAEGSYTFTVKAENGAGSDEKTFTINIELPPAPVITTASLPDGKKGFNYSQGIYANDAAIWSIASGSLPPGLNFYDGGYLFGTPIKEGEYTFTVKAENGAGSDEKTFTINIELPPAPVITTASLPDGKKGLNYRQRIDANDAAIWSIASGSLPPGLNFYDGGYLFGTPIKEGSYTFTVKAENGAGSDEKTFTINIELPPAPVITTASLPDGKKGFNYSQRIDANDAAIWSIASGSLPPGLNFYDGGYLSGNPTAEGSYTFTVKAENAIGNDTKEFTINIEIPPAPIIYTTWLQDGKKGLNYHQRIDATDAATLSIESGDLPPGLSLSSWYISGNPTAEGSYTFTVKAENGAGSDEKTFTINIELPPAPVITTASLPDGKKGFNYSKGIYANDAAIWSIASGSLPPGLNFYDGGYLFGTPTVEGEYTFTVKAENAIGNDTKEFTINIEIPPAPIIYTTWLQDGKKGLNYYQRIDATDAAIWSIASGSLPPGLVLNYYKDDKYGSYEGYISGTPTVEGEYTFTVKAENAIGNDTKEFTINIEIPPAPIIYTTWLQDGKKGLNYYQRIDANDAETFSIVGGSLPPGLNFYDDGYLFGTPIKEGEYTFTVKAENGAGSDEKTFTINIELPPAPVIATPWLTDGKKGLDYEQEIYATNVETFSIVSGSLPPGLSLSDWGYIHGTPTKEGEYTFTVKAENVTSSVEKTFTINIEIPPAQPAPVITTVWLPDGEKGFYYKQEIYATDAETFSIVSGSLPPGLVLSRYDLGNIYGTPTAEGEYTFTVKAENTTGSVTKKFTINIEIPPAQPAPVITTASLPDGKKGFYYGQRIDATDAETFSIESGNLPPGLSLSDWGYIHGTPTREGEYTFTVNAENTTGSVTKTFTINIEIPPAPVITTISLSDGKQGLYYEQEIYATDAAIWSIASGSLPPGLVLNYKDDKYGSYEGYISGTPTVEGEYTFTVKAENVTSSVEKTFTINIEIPPAQPAPVITTASLTDGKKGFDYGQEIYATDAETFSIESGNLPPGLSLSDWGYIHGTPTKEGKYTFTVKAENATGSVTKTFTINIEIPPAPVITTASLPDGKQGFYYEQEIYATDAETFSIVSGSLPPGLSLSRRDGYISGTPTREGEYRFAINAENITGSVTKTFTINIKIPPAPIITAASLPNGKKGLRYEQEIDATDAATFSIVSGRLPPGLSLQYNYYSYSISGTPTLEGEYTFTVKAMNATGRVEKTFTINIEIPSAPVITVTWPTSATITYGQTLANAIFAGQSGAGTFAFTNSTAKPSVAQSGTQYELTFTPTNDNYNILTKNVAVTVNKATGLENDAPVHRQISASNSETHTYDLSILAFNKSDLGTLSYTLGAFTDRDNILAAAPTLNGTILSFKGAGKTSGIATQAITVTSQNYKDIIITITFETTPKTEVAITGVKSQSYVYDGSTKKGYTGTPLSGAYTGELLYEYAGTNYPQTTTQPTNAGKYTIKISLPSYAPYVGVWSDSFDIAKATPTYEIPTGLTATVGQKLGSITMPAGWAWADATTVVVAGTQKYKASFTPSDLANYNILTNVDVSVVGTAPSSSSIDPTPSSSSVGTAPSSSSIGTAPSSSSVGTAPSSSSIGKTPSSSSIDPTPSSSSGTKTPIFTNRENPRIGRIGVQTTPNSIQLSNLPPNAKVEVYNLQGKRIYSAYPENPKILKIGVQTKGIYFVKINTQTLRVAVR